MTHLTDTATRSRSGFDVSALDRIDRVLVGGCVVVWLAALGAGVAATVALVDLSHGTETSSADSGTPWFLYTVIGVSAAVIIAAVPLLLRARRATDEGLTPVERRMAAAADRQQSPARPVDAPTEKLRIPPAPDTNSGRLPRVLQPSGPAAVDSPAVDRLWLRGATSLGTAIGAATLLVAVGTYLMAVDSVTAAWVLYGLAGVLTVGMVAIPWYFLRELRAEVAR